tara:strand:+ start:1884 stop:3173 length:1290 start_codon:yes stop_codon:yes gene_type:complete
MYSFTFFHLNDKIFYEIKIKSGSIFNLIKDIDSDESFIINFYNDNINRIKFYLNKYIKLNKKIVKNNLDYLSIRLYLILNYIFKEKYKDNISYEHLKNNVLKVEEYNDFFIDDWFRIFIKEKKENKYLIFKGYNGFCDRLQCLLEIFRYCEVTKRILVIDWNDIHWTFDDKGFDYYFNIKNLDYLELNDFKKILINKINLSIYPKIWEKDIFLKYNDDIYETKYNLSDNNKIVNSIIHGNDDFPHDIIVYSASNDRILGYYNLFHKYFNINTYILNKIYNHNFYKEIILKKQKYVCIHLRGSDKMVKNKFHYNGSINNDEYIDKLINKLDNSIMNILIISDTNLLINKCIEKLNKYKKYNIYKTDNYKTNLKIGLHQQDKNQLQVSKQQINIEMIIDFYFMIKSDKIINDNYSIFSNFARKIQEYKINY